jgi:hypothetical protein
MICSASAYRMMSLIGSILNVASIDSFRLLLPPFLSEYAFNSVRTTLARHRLHICTRRLQIVDNQRRRIILYRFIDELKGSRPRITIEKGAHCLYGLLVSPLLGRGKAMRWRLADVRIGG